MANFLFFLAWLLGSYGIFRQTLFRDMRILLASCLVLGASLLLCSYFFDPARGSQVVTNTPRPDTPAVFVEYQYEVKEGDLTFQDKIASRASQPLTVRNTSTGPLYNVQIQPVYNDGREARFPLVAVVNPNSPKEVLATIYRDGNELPRPWCNAFGNMLVSHEIMVKRIFAREKSPVSVVPMRVSFEFRPGEAAFCDLEIKCNHKDLTAQVVLTSGRTIAGQAAMS